MEEEEKEEKERRGRERRDEEMEKQGTAVRFNLIYTFEFEINMMENYRRLKNKLSIWKKSTS